VASLNVAKDLLFDASCAPDDAAPDMAPSPVPVPSPAPKMER
jgi:hypothetical protein